MQNRLWLGIAALLAVHAAPLAAQPGDQAEAPLERHHVPPDELLAELNQVVADVPRSGLTEELAGRLIELGRQLEEVGRGADACRALASFGDTPSAVADLAEELRGRDKTAPAAFRDPVLCYWSTAIAFRPYFRIFARPSPPANCPPRWGRSRRICKACGPPFRKA